MTPVARPHRIRALAVLPLDNFSAGDLNRAFSLQSRLGARSNLPPSLAADPLFDTLRSDARYTQLNATR